MSLIKITWITIAQWVLTRVSGNLPGYSCPFRTLFPSSTRCRHLGSEKISCSIRWQHPNLMRSHMIQNSGAQVWQDLAQSKMAAPRRTGKRDHWGHPSGSPGSEPWFTIWETAIANRNKWKDEQLGWRRKKKGKNTEKHSTEAHWHS